MIFSKDFIDLFGRIWGIIVVVGMCLMFTAFIIFSLIGLIVLLKDYKALKHNSFVSITGKVIGLKRNRNPDSCAQINDHPIVMIMDTNEEIVLILNDWVTVGETYKFNYLKNSKIAEIVEKV